MTGSLDCVEFIHVSDRLRWKCQLCGSSDRLTIETEDEAIETVADIAEFHGLAICDN